MLLKFSRDHLLQPILNFLIITVPSLDVFLCLISGHWCQLNVNRNLQFEVCWRKLYATQIAQLQYSCAVEQVNRLRLNHEVARCFSSSWKKHTHTQSSVSRGKGKCTLSQREATYIDRSPCAMSLIANEDFKSTVWLSPKVMPWLVSEDANGYSCRALIGWGKS